MTDGTRHLADAEDRSGDHQQAREACQHALNTVTNGDLSRTGPLLVEALAATERAQSDDLSG